MVTITAQLPKSPESNPLPLWSIWLNGTMYVCVFLCIYLFLKISPPLLERQIQREEKQKYLPSTGTFLKWPQQPALANLNAEDCSRSPTCIPRIWIVLHYSPRPQTGSQMGSGAAGTQTSTHMGYQCFHGKDLVNEPACTTHLILCRLTLT